MEKVIFLWIKYHLNKLFYPKHKLPIRRTGDELTIGLGLVHDQKLIPQFLLGPSSFKISQKFGRKLSIASKVDF